MTGTNKTLGRSSTDRDFAGLDGAGARAWLLESACRSLGPYVEYPDGTVTDRRTGKVLGHIGEPGCPRNLPREADPGKRWNSHRGL